MRILDMLATDHRQVLEWFDRIAADEDSSDEDRAKLFAEARALLLAHDQAEEETIYQLLAQKGDRAQAQIIAQENDHAVAEQLIGDLDQLTIGSDEWDGLFSQLVTIVEDHVEAEEAEMFPLARELLPEVDDIATEFDLRKEELLVQMHGHPAS